MIFREKSAQSEIHAPAICMYIHICMYRHTVERIARNFHSSAIVRKVRETRSRSRLLYYYNLWGLQGFSRQQCYEQAHVLGNMI